MANPPIDRVVKAEIRFTWNGQLVENVMHFRNTIDQPSPADMEVLGNLIADTVNPDWLSVMTSTVTFREVYIEDYAGSISQSATVAGLGSGAVTGDSMPGGTTFCLSLRTGFVGRARRGRIYTIGMNEGQQSGGVVTSGYRNAWITNIQQLMLAVGTTNWELVVVSFMLNGLPRDEPLVTPVTTVLAVDDFVDSQRRRLQGRGA